MLTNNRIPAVYILKKIKYEALLVLVIGLLTQYFTSEFKELIPIMPISIPAFIGTAISVILSFKLNQSYDRWWEARKVWGSIVNDSRSFVIQLQSFVSRDKHAQVKEIAYRHIAWCYSLGQSLRGLDPVKGLDPFLSASDRLLLERHNNKPLALLQLNAAQIAQLRESESLNVFSHVQINTTMVNFSNWMGMAERIKTTIFPVTYRLFLHFFIYVFAVTLSIALRDIKSVFEIPLLLVITSAFFLLERSATHLQDPFSNKPTDTAMTTIARNIEINIRQLLGESQVPEPLKPQKFYAM